MKYRPAPAAALAVVIGVSVALAPLADVFQGWQWAARLIGTSLTAAGIAVAVESRYHRAPLPIVTALSAGGAMLWGLLVMSRTFAGDPFARAPWLELRDGLLDGWGALLDNDIPLRDAPTAEIFVAALVWSVTAVAVHVVARRHTALAAVAASAVVLWVSVAAALPAGVTPSVFGAASGAAVLLVVATTSGIVDGHWRAGHAMSLVVMLFLAAGAAAAASQMTLGAQREPLDPRSARANTIVELEVPDILSELTIRRSDESRFMTVESASADPLPPELRLRLQTYDTHDGERWLPSVEFREIGTFPAPTLLPPGEFVSLRLDVEQLGGPWIPVPDRLISTDLTDIRWNEVSQTGLSDRPLGRYRVTGTTVGREQLDGLPSARDDVDELFTQVPAALPESIRGAAEVASAGTADAITAIDAVTALVREMGRDDTVAPGHSLARLRDDLTAAAPTGAEQLASLHVLMLRSLGHPSRVVVGFVTSDSIISSEDLHVWSEVAFPGIGWIAFDPVPQPSEALSDPGPEQSTTTTLLTDDAVIQARALPRELGPGEDPGEQELAKGSRFTLSRILGAVIALLILAATILIGVRVVRRRRRERIQNTEQRVLGAWAELVDRLREAGAPIAATTTIDDVGYMAESLDPDLGLAARDLGDLASAALHSPIDCSSEDSDAAWIALRRAESALVSVRGRRVHASRLLDPRALRYRSPTPPSSRDGGRRSQLTRW